MEQKTTEKIIKKYNCDRHEVLEMLLDIQEKEKYLPRETLDYVAERLDMQPAKLYHLATFYEALSLKPAGRCQVNVCTGTACHVRGAVKILDELEYQLGIKPGEVTSDYNFGLKTVNCVGACALGPLVLVNGEYQGDMTARKVEKIIKENTDHEDKERKQA